MARLFRLGQSANIRYHHEMLFWRPKDRENPPPVLDDIRNLWSEEQPHKWKILAFSIFMTGLMVFAFAKDFHFYAPYKEPEIEWVRSLDKDRSMAEIKADQARFAELTRAEREAEFAASEERKAGYRRLAKRFGMEVVEDK